MRSFLPAILALSALACSPAGLSPSDDDTRSDAVRAKTSDETETVDGPRTQDAPAATADAMPSMLVRTGNGTSSVRYQERDGKRIAFGDIVLPPEPDMPSVATAVGQVRLWPKGVIPYVVSSANKAAVQAGIAMWHAKTKRIQFVPRTTEKDYLDFFRGDGCYSDIGRKGGKQQLSIGSGCEPGYIVAHELGHAIGFWHEQSRSDRDNYLIVRPQNAAADMRFNFDKLTFKSIGTFDYSSIMLYESYSFSSNKQPTILRKDGSLIKDPTALSAGDIAGAEALYASEGQPGTTPAPTPTTPAPEPTANSEYQATTTANLNLRAGPGAGYAVLGVIPQGSVVELTGDASSSYYGVVYEGTAGWVHAAYLQ